VVVVVVTTGVVLSSCYLYIAPQMDGGYVVPVRDTEDAER
jgi:hypothetical protein